MPNVIGQNGLEATATIESATNGQASVQTENADDTGIVSSTIPAAGTVLTGLCSQNSLDISVTIVT
jgi:beta-lactam-binding protein with PASTA domain